MFSASLKGLVALSLIAGLRLASAVEGQVVPKDISKNLAPIDGIAFRQPSAKYSYTPNLNSHSIHQHTLRRASHQKTNPRSAAAILGGHQRSTSGVGAYVNITSASALGTVWAIQIGWSGTPLLVVLNTASSDTWVVQSNFTCIGSLGSAIPREQCRFGPGYNGTFQYGSIYDVGLDIEYADGSFATGPMGYSDITIGNITVKNQEVALVNQTYWIGGDNLTSGLIGLGYPALTSAYEGGRASESEPWINQAPYNPIFTSMVNQSLSQPMFSVAIHRGSSDGALAFGGPPPVPGIDFTTLASTGILIADLINDPFDSIHYSFYSIVPSGIRCNGTYNTNQYPYIIDTGTTLMYLPPDLATTINNAFDPPAEWLFREQSYYVACNATPPHLAITINGVDFGINPKDMIYQDVIDPYSGKCMTAIASGLTGPYILGAAFLQNVVAVFDVGNSQMHFLGHQYY